MEPFSLWHHELSTFIFKSVVHYMITEEKINMNKGIYYIFFLQCLGTDFYFILFLI